MTGRLLTTRQVAEHVGFSPETVLRRYRAGEIPGIRLGSNALRFLPQNEKTPPKQGFRFIGAPRFELGTSSPPD